ncbi:MAG: hypothetical protein NT075_35795, partial [Chloroflexi bacterium]|nr:hypothetical protein [Chloroflexota bacterium]
GAVGIDMEMDSANISSPEFSQGMVQGTSLIQVAVNCRRNERKQGQANSSATLAFSSTASSSVGKANHHCG